VLVFLWHQTDKNLNPGASSGNSTFKFTLLPSVYIPWLIFVGLVVFTYYPTFEWMIWRFEEANSYSSHGYLIPFISLFLIYQTLVELGPIPRAVHNSGWFFVGASLLLHLLAGTADVASLSGMSLISLLIGGLLLSYGVQGIKRFWFPILFLFFMVPLPDFMISTLNFKLKFWASDVAAWLLNFSGFPAIRDGSFMLFEGERLAIGDVCSGLRSLLSLIALGLLYTWVIRKEHLGQIGLLLISILPAAVIGNGIRIFLVTLLVASMGSEAVFKPLIGEWDLHLFTGAFIFIGAFGILWLVQQLAKTVFPTPKKVNTSSDQTEQPPAVKASPVVSLGPWHKSRSFLILVLLLILSGALTHAFLFKQPIRAHSDLTKNISKTIGPWSVIRENKPSDAEYEGLETTDIIKRHYFDGQNTIELVVAYIPRSNRKSAHAQEACLRGSGAMVSQIETKKLQKAPVIATKITIDHHQQQSRVFYWYKIGNKYTSEFLKSSFRMYLAGLWGQKQQGAALVRLLSPTSSSERPEQVNQRLEEFARLLIPELEKKLP